MSQDPKKRIEKQNVSSAPRSSTSSAASSWDPVARWYGQWAGKEGSDYHRLAIPTILELVQPKPQELIVDIGCGTGVVAHALPRSVRYLGIDASPRLLARARGFHGRERTFVQADAARLFENSELSPGMADAVVFCLSIQDMEPLSAIISNAAWLLKKSGRLVILMFHPCFRIPRQSGWGWDEGRSLQYRRIDSYLSPKEVPVRPIAKGESGSIKAYHHPLEAYINGLMECGLALTALKEIPAYPTIRRRGERARAENRSNKEIPLFLAVKATKSGG